MRQDRLTTLAQQALADAQSDAAARSNPEIAGLHLVLQEGFQTVFHFPPGVQYGLLILKDSLLENAILRTKIVDNAAVVQDLPLEAW